MKNMIVLIGGQGVGKGTYAGMLCQKHDYKYIEVGAILRTVSPDSEIGQIVARGDLVSDEALFDLLGDYFDTDKDIILDGCPRKLSQAKLLIQKFADKFNIRVIYLNVPESVMIERLHKRVREGGNRADDADEAIIRHRLDNFWKNTIPAIDWLRTVPNIKFFDVDVSEQDVNENFARVYEAVNK